MMRRANPRALRRLGAWRTPWGVEDGQAPPLKAAARKGPGLAHPARAAGSTQPVRGRAIRRGRPLRPRVQRRVPRSDHCIT
jgi:hypothetical protein